MRVTARERMRMRGSECDGDDEGERTHALTTHSLTHSLTHLQLLVHCFLGWHVRVQHAAHIVDTHAKVSE